MQPIFLSNNYEKFQKFLSSDEAQVAIVKAKETLDKAFALAGAIVVKKLCEAIELPIRDKQFAIIDKLIELGFAKFNTVDWFLHKEDWIIVPMDYDE